MTNSEISLDVCDMSIAKSKEREGSNIDTPYATEGIIRTDNSKIIVDTASTHTCVATTADNEVYCMGNNKHGQIGNGAGNSGYVCMYKNGAFINYFYNIKLLNLLLW